MYRAILVFGVVMLATFVATGQEGAPQTLPTDPAAAPQADTSPARPSQGDVITLKSGKVLTGMQVIRRTVTTLEVEVLPSLEPLEIPRRLVKSVVYDDIDPIKARRRMKHKMIVPAGNVTSGEEISPQLHKKLNKPLSKQTFTDKDFIVILAKLAKDVQLTLVFDISVELLPIEKRKWSVTVKATSTVDGILRGPFQTDFPVLTVNYQFDKVIITMSKAQPTQSQGLRTRPNRP